MKNVFGFLCKLVISSVLAFFILSAFVFFYDNPPTAVEQPNRYTNYKFQTYEYWSYMNEGFGFGRTNNIGYNSMTDISFTDPVIVFLGSSHTESFQIPQSKNFVSIVSKELHEDANTMNDYPCVNLGISSHFFNVCVSKFQDCLDAFVNTKLAVIETKSLVYTEEELDKMINEEYHDPYKEKGKLYDILRRIPLLRTLKTQFDKMQFKETNQILSTDPLYDYGVYENKLKVIMQNLQTSATEKDVHLIILYHNPISVTKDNIACRTDDIRLVEIFRESCETNGITFIDATENFMEHYQETYQMPYGFSNTAPGVGHLNETGHRIIADVIYNRIVELLRGR